MESRKAEATGKAIGKGIMMGIKIDTDLVRAAAEEIARKAIEDAGYVEVEEAELLEAPVTLEECEEGYLACILAAEERMLDQIEAGERVDIGAVITIAKMIKLARKWKGAVAE